MGIFNNLRSVTETAARRTYARLYARFVTGRPTLYRLSKMRHGRVVSGTTRRCLVDLMPRGLRDRPPLVSCVLTYRGDAERFNNAVACYRRQTYPNTELLIVSSREDEQLQKRVAEFGDHRLTLIAPETTGDATLDLSEFAVRRASGQYLCHWSDSHLADPTRIQRQINALSMLGVDVCFIERPLIWNTDRQVFVVAAPRAWEETLLCKRTALPPPECGTSTLDDAYVVKLLNHVDVALLDQPQLYVDIVDIAKSSEPALASVKTFCFPALPFMQKRLQARLQLESDCWSRVTGRATLLPATADPRPPTAVPSTELCTLGAETPAIDATVLPKGRFTTGIVLTSFNRPQYLGVVLTRLQQSDCKDCIVLIVDDGSTDERTLKLIAEFRLQNAPLLKFRKPRNCGVESSLRLGWDLLSHSCDYLCNLDSDAIVKPFWLTALRQAHHRFREASPESRVIVTGFNSDAHLTLSSNSQFAKKLTIGGINMFFDQSLYREGVAPALGGKFWDHRVVDCLYGWSPGTTDSIHVHGATVPPIPSDAALVCTTPSVVQHIGVDGMHGDVYASDFASDF